MSVEGLLIKPDNDGNQRVIASSTDLTIVFRGTRCRAFPVGGHGGMNLIWKSPAVY